MEQGRPWWPAAADVPGRRACNSAVARRTLAWCVRSASAGWDGKGSVTVSENQRATSPFRARASASWWPNWANTYQRSHATTIVAIEQASSKTIVKPPW